MAILQEFALAEFLCPTAGHLGVRRRDLGLGDLKILAVLLGVEPSEEIPLLDLRSDIDRPLQDLAVDPEANIGLVARLYLAGQRERLSGLAGFDGHRAHRPDIRRCGLLFLVTGS